ncbi:hypothetical protein [Algoriphagus sp.]|uniref:hypothetical protein n=1 Tax=Algoriphagus sp. TaxID=1872435 RepID=UPI003F718DC4
MSWGFALKHDLGLRIHFLEWAKATFQLMQGDFVFVLFMEMGAPPHLMVMRLKWHT